MDKSINSVSHSDNELTIEEPNISSFVEYKRFLSTIHDSFDNVLREENQ